MTAVGEGRGAGLDHSGSKRWHSLCLAGPKTALAVCDRAQAGFMVSA